MDRVVFEEKLPEAFEPEPFENQDLILVPSICLTRRGMQNYITIPVLNRSNHDVILPPNTSQLTITKSSSVNSTNRTSTYNRKIKSKVNSKEQS